MAPIIPIDVKIPNAPNHSAMSVAINELIELKSTTQVNDEERKK